MMLLLITVVICWGATVFAQTPFIPTSGIQCLKNDDCDDLEHKCCSITPLLGKREVKGASATASDVGGEWYPYVHYCLPYKAADAPWCDLDLQYSTDSPNYFGLCPCGPGLRCIPTEDLDPKWYPRERFGKCAPS
ncbi:uncharacterized protein LOC112554226 [Pomacea canaliculata]|uniref:uncharacterized protein LOC112554226 n=1 Tax=Pomacea canaliculata TaxID=400727 RepID=UPI000D72ACD3|nr:uncharacterized protein LOC112554226 [Pomacea canaliculata]